MARLRSTQILQDLSSVTCPLCLDVFNAPCKINCGHTFCTACLQQFRGESAPKCPICRKPFDPERRERDTHMEGYLASSVAECEGCKKQFSVNQLGAHTNTCTLYAALAMKRIGAVQSPLRNAPVVPNRQTFKCPYCSVDHLDQNGLVKHCLDLHVSSRNHVVCPICASMPWGDPTLVSSNFIAHLSNRHKFEYDTYVDYEQDDDAMMRAALRASMMDR